MLYDRNELILLYFAYSFLGWCVETILASLIRKRFRNRGFAAIPFCMMYGTMGIAVTIVFKDLRRSVVLLFVGCALLCTLIQWITGLILEHMGGGKWWNYTRLPLNINGYIALPVSAVLGGIGTLAVLFINDVLVGFFRLFPQLLQDVIIWILVVVAVMDVLISMLSILHLGKKLPVRKWSKRARRFSDSIGNRISGYVKKRIAAAYPMAFALAEEWDNWGGAGQGADSGVKGADADGKGADGSGEKGPGADRSGAEGIRLDGSGGKGTSMDRPIQGGPAKEPDLSGHVSHLEIFWLFFVGALLGDGVETIFMWITRGRWMSRSSLVWGSFSVVWGLAVGVVSALLFRDRKRSDSYLFLVGTLMGGTYEYLCSVFTELVFGAVFWDYKHIPFNIGGRVNLLYCFFWGIAAVIWIRLAFPLIHKVLTAFLRWERRIISSFAILFMIANIIISCFALIRYDERSRNIEAGNKIAVYMDKIYNDEMMRRKYPGAKRRRH